MDVLIQLYQITYKTSVQENSWKRKLSKRNKIFQKFIEKIKISIQKENQKKLKNKITYLIFINREVKY
jgi:hypothetical protein